ncbi:hypothetical protein F5888DRAFT_1807678 [Russula emetica]|nr:hypothetical protein F5888DRAFT_1807678 [Russula emetica]
MPVTHRFPSSFETLVLQNQRKQQNKSLYNDVRIVERPIPALKPGELLVKINAAGFNHRELWIQRGLYPGIVPGSTLGSDGAGIAVAAHNENNEILNKRVFLVPTRGWEKDPLAPEAP